MGFKHLDHTFTYKYVKDQVESLLKGRWSYLKKQIETSEKRPQNCMEMHWNQIKEVLKQEDNVERAPQMTRIWAIRNNASQCGWSGEMTWKN